MKYLQTLTSQTNKYRFEASSPQFLHLYYDTILRLYDRGFLFEDDPELREVHKLLANGSAQYTTDALGNKAITLFASNPMNARLTTRNRVIFPYLRRLLETQKAAQVTKRRVDSLNEQIPPSAEIRHALEEKMREEMRVWKKDGLNDREITRTRAICRPRWRSRTISWWRSTS